MRAGHIGYPLRFPRTAPAALYTLSLHDALPISTAGATRAAMSANDGIVTEDTAPDEVWIGADCALDLRIMPRSEEHTSELQSRGHLVCRLLLEKKNARRQILISTSRRPLAGSWR